MVHLYACNENMTNKPSGESRSLYNSDGDMLIVPQQGALRVTTEFGRMLVSPHEICVVQRGIRFSVDVEGPSRGYICEILKGHFEIPSLGPIGANGLANPRDFVTPVAWYEGYTPEHTEAAEAAGAVATSVATTAPAVASAASSGAADPAAAAASSSSSASASTSTSTGAAAAGGGLSGASGRWVILNKYGHGLFAAEQAHSPYDVVGWHGNYAPYKYNLDDFVCMNSVTVDHPDPSIYTVLTCQSDTPGVAITDFVIFPPRWMVMERSFRPPYYHRNCMTEYMGMVYGKYDAKVGFVPGGSSLHSIGTPHGPDAPTFKGASTAELAPEKFDGGLAFMFETCEVLKLTEYALRGPDREWAYQACWSGLPALFKPGRPVVTPAELAAGVSASIASAAGTGEAAAAAAHAAADAVASGAPSASAAAASSSSH
jgi:homogentisate 1,2-dioxygenase